MEGCHRLNGIMTAQVPSFDSRFEQIFRAEIPSRVVEIGTGYGGSTLALRFILNLIDYEIPMMTWDIPDIYKYCRYGFQNRYELENYAAQHLNLVTRIDHVFKDPLFKAFVQAPGKCIILCDGPHKPEEVHYAKSLAKSGDLICVHDYAESLEIFDLKYRHRVWNWLEAYDELLDLDGLYPTYRDILADVMWGAFKCV